MLLSLLSANVYDDDDGDDDDDDDDNDDNFNNAIAGFQCHAIQNKSKL